MTCRHATLVLLLAYAWWPNRRHNISQLLPPPSPPPIPSSTATSPSASASASPTAGWIAPRIGRKATSPQKGQVLLAIFERPPQAAGETINSAVLIATENASSYPGLKQAEDYLGPLTELTTSKGFKAVGDPSVMEIDARQLVRADFTRALSDKLTMHQSTLVLLAKGQIVSFTFLAGGADEVSDLIARLSFTPAKARAQ